MENDIWGKSWQSFEHNFPRGALNAVEPFAQPSIFLKRALVQRGTNCVKIKNVFFFSKIATIPLSQPVLSTRIALLVFSLLNSCKTSTTCSA